MVSNHRLVGSQKIFLYMPGSFTSASKVLPISSKIFLDRASIPAILMPSGQIPNF
jgi:hypothetical protein